MTLADATEALAEVAEYARPGTDVVQLLADGADVVHQQSVTHAALVQANRAVDMLVPDGTASSRAAWMDAMRTLTRLRIRTAELAMEEAFVLCEVQREVYWARTHQAQAHAVAA